MNLAIKTMALQQHWGFHMLLFIMLPTAPRKGGKFFKFRFASVNKFLWFYIRNFNRNVFGFCKKIFNKSLEFFARFDLHV